MQHNTFDLRDFLSGALSRTKASGSEQQRRGELLCEGCCAKFPFYKRKKQCGECRLVYCGNCLSLPGGASTLTTSSVLSRIVDKNQQYCRKCHVLLARPLCRADLQQLRVKDLQHYLTAHHVSFRGCVEKEDLVNLLIRYVGSTGSYNDVRQSAAGSTAGFHSPPNFSESDQSSTSSNPPHGRRSSVPNLPSPTDAPPPGSTVPLHATRSATDAAGNTQSPTNPVSATSPVVSSPVLGGGGETRERPDVEMDFEELLDWEVIGGAMETGPEPVVSEADDEMDATTPPRNETHYEVRIDEVVDEHLGIPAEPSAEPSDAGSAAENSPAQTPRTLVLASIKSLDDLEQLTVKQLKELLIRNRVDFRGCVEKAELIERVSRLWTESKEARKDLDNLSMDELCKICMDAPVECVMLECGHMATCTTCGKQLNECPICRQYVVRVVRIFKA